MLCIITLTLTLKNMCSKMYLIELKQETVKNDLSNLQATKGLNIEFWDLCWQRSWENALKRKKMIGHLLFLIQVQKFLRVLKTQSATSCQVFEGAGCSLLFSQGCRHTRINNYMLPSLHNSCKNEFFFFPRTSVFVSPYWLWEISPELVVNTSHRAVQGGPPSFQTRNMLS